MLYKKISSDEAKEYEVSHIKESWVTCKVTSMLSSMGFKYSFIGPTESILALDDMNKYSVGIIKYTDEWYLITMYQDNTGRVQYYLCDEIDGVMEYMKDYNGLMNDVLRNQMCGYSNINVRDEW